MSGLGMLIWSIAAFVLVIGPLVFIHELGHYTVGRMCGVKVETFSIGFGRELIGWTDSAGTRWKVAALPLGGYVKFAGDMGPASTPSPEWLALPAHERARTFQAKPVWQRFLIVAAGPAVNFLFAFAVVAGILLAYGEPVTKPVIASVLPRSGAAEAGLRPGDAVRAIDGTPVRRFEDIASYTMVRPDTRLTIRLERDGRPMTVVARTHGVDRTDQFGNAARVGVLGIGTGPGAMEPVPLVEVPSRAMGYVGDAVVTTVVTLRQIVVGTRSVKEMSGPVGVARIAGEQATLGWFPVVLLMAGISINLGFINLLPVPMLDGGHLLFYLVEAVRRKPVEPMVQEWAFRSGLALLLGLMLFVTVNDLGNAGLWQRLAGLIS